MDVPAEQGAHVVPAQGMQIFPHVSTVTESFVVQKKPSSQDRVVVKVQTIGVPAQGTQTDPSHSSRDSSSFSVQGSPSSQGCIEVNIQGLSHGSPPLKLVPWAFARTVTKIKKHSEVKNGWNFFIILLAFGLLLESLRWLRLSVK